MKLRAKKEQLPLLWGRDANGYRIQPTTEQIVEGIRLRGGKLLLDDDYELRAWLPKKNRKRLQELLRDCHARVFQYLLERRPRIEIPVACRCDTKPYPHVAHDWEDEQSKVHIKETLPRLRDALVRCQSQPEGWDMNDLLDYMEETKGE